MNYAGRVGAAQAALAETECDALIVSSLVNVRYLTGYAGSNGMVVIEPGGATFITDFRYVTAAEPIRDFMDVKMAEREAVRFAAENLAELAPDAARVGVEASNMTLAAHRILSEHTSAELVPTTGVVERLREVKDSDELDAVRRSAALIAPVYEELAAEGLEGRRELDVAWRVRELFHEQGAAGLSFDTIVASHERGAMPHADPSEAMIGSGTLVTIDLGCILDSYCSDCTRTFATGDPPEELLEIYEICLRAQEAAVDAVRPGAGGQDVDGVARDIIADAGYGDNFGHGLGHGVGLDVHEGPRLGTRSDATLEPGMVVTVEPGIYLPGQGGVRIEDLVIVTEDGCERLTPYPKHLTRV